MHHHLIIPSSLLPLAVALLLVACGGGDEPSGDDGYTLADVSVAAGDELNWTFDGDAEGALPEGSEQFNGEWTVRAEAGAPTAPNALCQTATAEFPALSLGDSIFGDVTVSALFKPISGETDQAAGIIFRVQDEDNYYIVRANALENNVDIYKYADGRRTQVASGDAPVENGLWQDLSVEMHGDDIRAFLSGQLVVQATDSEYPAGKVGLWTKADSVTCFDDVSAVAE